MEKELEKDFVKKIIKLLKEFIDQVEATKALAYDNYKLSVKQYSTCIKKYSDALGKAKEKVDSGVEDLSLLIAVDATEKLQSKYNQTKQKINIIPSSMLVSLISNLDYFIANMLKEAMSCQEGTIYTLVSPISYAEINEFENINQIKEYYIEKVIENLFRESHENIFKCLDEKYSISNIRKYDIYDVLIFITEIRNIIVHNNGLINMSFKANMKKYRIDYEKYDIIKKNRVTLKPSKLNDIGLILLNFSIRFFWEYVSHFVKDEELLDFCYGEANNICLKYYLDKQEDFCINLYDFILKKKLDSSNRFLFTINKCMCLKKKHKSEEMLKVLNSLDWSNCDEKFKFAKTLLLDDFDESIKYIKQNNFDEMEYRFQFWPLCEDFVKTEIFRTKYRELYGFEYEKKLKDIDLTDVEQEINKLSEKDQDKIKEINRTDEDKITDKSKEESKEENDEHNDKKAD